MRNSIFEVFNIDNSKFKTLIRVIFVVLILLELALVFKPIGNSDFEEYFDWSEEVLTSIQNNDVEEMNSLLDSMPITKGHIIYLFTNLAVKLIEFYSIIFYCSIFIKGYREDNNKNSLKWSNLLCRFMLVCLALTIVLIPASFIIVLLFLLFIIILPYVIMFPACYVSGDNRLFGSVSKAIKINKGFYWVNLKNLSLIFVLNILAGLVVSVVAEFSTTAGYVINSFVNIWFCLAIGRYIGMTYCHIVDKVPVSTDKM